MPSFLSGGITNMFLREQKKIQKIIVLCFLITVTLSCSDPGQTHIIQGKRFLTEGLLDNAIKEFKGGYEYYLQNNNPLKMIECSLLQEAAGLNKGFFQKEVNNLERIYLNFENNKRKEGNRLESDFLAIQILLYRIKAYIYAFEFPAALTLLEETEKIFSDYLTRKKSDEQINPEEIEKLGNFFLYTSIIKAWNDKTISLQLLNDYKKYCIDFLDMDIISQANYKLFSNISEILKTAINLDNPDFMWLLTGIIYSSKQIDFSEKIIYLNKITDFFKSKNHPCFYGYANYFSALLLDDEDYSSGNAMDTLKVYEEALPLMIQIGKDDFYNHSLFRMAVIRYERGQFSRALDSFYRVLDYYQQNKNISNVAEIKNYIGTINKSFGHLTIAEKEFQEVLTLYEEIRDVSKVAACYNNLGIIYKDQLLYNKALDYFNEALKIIDLMISDENNADKLKSLYEAKFIKLNNMAEIEISRGLYDEAINRYLEPLKKEISGKGLSGSFIDATVKTNYAACRYFLIRENPAFNPGMCDDIFKLLNEALAIFEESNKSLEINEIKYLMGQISFNITDYESAFKIYKELEHFFDSSKNLSHLAGVYYSLYLTENELGKNKEATASLKKSVEKYDAYIKYIPSFEGQNKIYDRYLPYFEILIKRLLEEDKVEEAFYYSEKMKARILLQQMKQMEQMKSDTLLNIPEEIRNKLKEISMAETIIIKELELNYSYLSIDKVHVEDLKVQLKKYEDQRLELFHKIRVFNAYIADINEVYATNTKAIQECLKPGQLMISYVFIKDQLYVFLIDNKSIEFTQLTENKFKREEFCNTINTYRKKLENINSDPDKESYRLYDFLMAPIFKKSASYSHLIIIPTDELFYIPFYALKNKDSGQYLLDEYKGVISCSISSTVYAGLFHQKKTDFTQEYIGIGHPDYQDKYSDLKFSGKELEEIQILFGNSGEIFTREQANEILVQKHDFTPYRYIHFSCHGINYGNSGFLNFPALVLARGSENDKNDGFLKYDEISPLELNADMVLLSACRTGLGKMVKGDGLVGLNQAFFIAGARSVISSLWNVDDYFTKVLVTDFFKSIKAGNTIPVALKSAMVNTKTKSMSDRVSSHPFYWAPFVITGYNPVE